MSFLFLQYNMIMIIQPNIQNYKKWGLKKAPLFFLFALLPSALITYIAWATPANAAEQLAQASSAAESTIETGREEMDRIRAAILENFDLGTLEREVTFEDVLADPDNIEINILYARTQILKGRLDRAQAAIERILLQRPDLHYVRMLYGVVLYRLGNFVEAQGVFNKILSSDISVENKLQAKKYMDDIEAKNKRTKFIFSTAMGIHYDSNKNAAPESGSVLLLDTIIPNSVTKKDDTGTLLSATLEARHDLGLQRAHELYGKINITTDQQAAQDDLDLIVGRIDVGGLIISDIGEFDVSVNHNRINMSQNFYLMENGIKLRWDALGGKKYRPYIEQKAQNQIYATTHNSSASEKNGWNMETRVGTKITFSPISLLDIYAMAGRKNAKEGYNTFNKKGAGVAYTRLFDRGRFLIFQGSRQINQYSDNDAFVSSITRRDTKTSLRMTGGMALASILPQDMPLQQLNDVQITGTVERSISGSNIINFDTINDRVQIMLSKTIRF